MNKIISVIMISLVVFGGVASAASVDWNATYVSQYIWRGQDLNGPSQPAIQPGLSFALPNGMSLGFWGSYDIGTAALGFTELDATLSYDSSIQKGLDYSVGYTYYTFPFGAGLAKKSGEIYGGLTLSEILFSPSLTLYYDHDQGNGLYSNLSGGYDFSLGQLPISSSVGVGYYSGQWGVTGLGDITVGLSSSFDAGEVSISPSLNYVRVASSVVNAGLNADSSEFWFGIDIASK